MEIVVYLNVLCSSDLYGRLPERRRVRGSRALRMRARVRRRALRARRGRVRAPRAPRDPRAPLAPRRAVRAARCLRQHARLLLLRVPRRLPARPAPRHLRRYSLLLVRPWYIDSITSKYFLEFTP